MKESMEAKIINTPDEGTDSPITPGILERLNDAGCGAIAELITKGELEEYNRFIMKYRNNVDMMSDIVDKDKHFKAAIDRLADELIANKTMILKRLENQRKQSGVGIGIKEVSRPAETTDYMAEINRRNTQFANLSSEAKIAQAEELKNYYADLAEAHPSDSKLQNKIKSSLLLIDESLGIIKNY